MAKASLKAKKATPVRSVSGNVAPRRLKAPIYKSFRLQKRIKTRPSKQLVPGSFRLLGRAFKVLFRHWKLFLGVVVLYALLNLLLVRGFSAGTDISQIRSTLSQSLGSGLGGLGSGLAIFVYLLGTTGNTSSTSAGTYQVILGVIVSLALVWLLREIYTGRKVRLRDGFYQGMYPLVPFLLVLLVVALEAVPLVGGMALYVIMVNNAILSTGLEQFLMLVALLMLGLISLYMVTSSLLALYIVALPGMAPVRALRAAANLIRYRRWLLMRKVAFLPAALILLAAILLLPIILLFAPAAPWAFFVVSAFLLPVIHSYMYALYRSLL